MTLGKGVTFVKCLPRSTRQRIHLCRVPPGTLGKGPAREGPHVRLFAECYVRHSAKRASLPSATDITLGKEPIPVPRSWFFAECYGLDTRQSDHEVPFLFVLLFHPNKQKIYISFTSHYISFASQNQHIYHQHHIYHKYHHINQVSQHISLTKYLTRPSITNITEREIGLHLFLIDFGG
jgi:hypothetical protein